MLLVFSLFGFNASAATKPDALVNSLYKLQSGSFKVGYFGGSVTVGAHASNAEKTSWRAITRDWFKTNFCLLQKVVPAHLIFLFVFAEEHQKHS